MATIFKRLPVNRVSDNLDTTDQGALIRYILVHMQNALLNVETLIGGGPGSGAGSTIVDQTRTWQTLQIFKDNTFKVVDDLDATKTFVFSLGGAVAGADLTLEWVGTADRTLKFPDVSGYLLPLAGYPTFGVLLSGQAYSP